MRSCDNIWCFRIRNLNDLRCIQPKQLLQFRLLQRVFGLQTIPRLRAIKSDVISMLGMLLSKLITAILNCFPLVKNDVL